MTPAVDVLRAAGVDFETAMYQADDGPDGYGADAAAALDLDPASVFKTLLADTGDGLVVGLVPVTGRLDLKALARAVGAKRATMAEPTEAERATGYVVGGISPLGQRRRLPTVLDQSALSLERIHVSGGRRGLEITLLPDDLVAVLDATVAPIASS